MLVFVAVKQFLLVFNKNELNCIMAWPCIATLVGVSSKVVGF